MAMNENNYDGCNIQATKSYIPDEEKCLINASGNFLSQDDSPLSHLIGTKRLDTVNNTNHLIHDLSADHPQSLNSSLPHKTAGEKASKSPDGSMKTSSARSSDSIPSNIPVIETHCLPVKSEVMETSNNSNADTRSSCNSLDSWNVTSAQSVASDKNGSNSGLLIKESNRSSDKGHPETNSRANAVNQHDADLSEVSHAADHAQKHSSCSGNDVTSDISCSGKNSLPVINSGRSQSRQCQPLKCRKTGPRKMLSNGSSLPLTHYFGSLHSNIKTECDREQMQTETSCSLGLSKPADACRSNLNKGISSVDTGVLPEDNEEENEISFKRFVEISPKNADVSITSPNRSSVAETSPLNTDSARKQPKAKKTFHVPVDSSPAKTKTPESRSTRAKIGFSRSVTGFQTVTLAELEKALGIEGQSIDKIDARTFDRIIISRMQEKLVARNGFSNHKSLKDASLSSAGDGHAMQVEQNSMTRKRRLLNQLDERTSHLASPDTLQSNSDRHISSPHGRHETQDSDVSDADCGALEDISITSLNAENAENSFVSRAKRRRMKSSSWARGSVIKRSNTLKRKELTDLSKSNKEKQNDESQEFSENLTSRSNSTSSPMKTSIIVVGICKSVCELSNLLDIY